MRTMLAAAAALTMAIAASTAANAVEMITVGDFTLQEGSFGGPLGVHWQGTASNVTSAIADIGNSGFTVQLSAGGLVFDTNGGGEATISDCTGNDCTPYSQLSLDFINQTWGALTFSFSGGLPEDPGALMSIAINGSSIFTGGNCTFCVIGNGENKFTLLANNANNLIDTVDFTFVDSISGAKQFRLEDAGVPGVIPEPATWAMMIGGFGMIGAMLRRRKHAVAAA